jgi:glycosyltransferase involved in cell wall biosynthesis
MDEAQRKRHRETAKIIFVNRFFFPDHSATSQLLSDLAFYLSDSNKNATVVTSRQIYDEPDARLAATETNRGVTVIRVWTTRFGRQRLIGRAIDYLSFYVSATWRLAVIARAGDVIVAKTDPPLISVPTAAVAWARGARLVNWLQDLFPEVASALDVKGMGTLAPVMAALRTWSLRRAAMNVVLGDYMAARVRALGIDDDKVAVIHNWADGRAIQPPAAITSPLRDEWGLTGRFVVGYSGNMGRAHEFETLLAIAERFRNEPGMCFLFIGGGALRPWIEAEAARRRLPNVLFKPYLPREALGQSLTVPDVHVVSLLPSLEGLIVPSKIYGILAAGRPVLFIGDKDGEVARLITAAGCGESIAPGAADDGVTYVRDLARNRARLQKESVSARRAFDQRYDMPLALGAWEELLHATGRRP